MGVSQLLVLVLAQALGFLVASQGAGGLGGALGTVLGSSKSVHPQGWSPRLISQTRSLVGKDLARQSGPVRAGAIPSHPGKVGPGLQPYWSPHSLVIVVAVKRPSWE